LLQPPFTLKTEKKKAPRKPADKKYIMKIALLTAIASLAHIGVYLFVRQADILSHSANVNLFWAALGLTFAYSFVAALNQPDETGNR
jgi:hypothetical protein